LVRSARHAGSGAGPLPQRQDGRRAEGL